jgi:IS30 family transposase
MGAGNRSAIGTLVERTTRYLVLLPFADGIASTDGVPQAITDALQSVPVGLRRTLTWDQGKELAHHQQITATTDTSVFFCDPHSPSRWGQYKSSFPPRACGCHRDCRQVRVRGRHMLV